MPIHEFQCEKCGKVTEQLILGGDKETKICEDCGGKTSKIMSLSSFHLKGSGWYVTDYKNKDKQKSTKKREK